MSHTRRLISAIAACLVALTACASTPEQSLSPSASPSAETPTPSAQPSPDEATRDGEPAVEADGRSYSYRRTISMEVPEHWFYLETPFDTLIQSNEDSPMDFLGSWIPDGDENTGTTVVMFMHIKPDPGVTADTYIGESGPVGNVVADERGRQMEVVGNGSLALGDGIEVFWMDVEADIGDGTAAVVRTYAFDSSQGGIVSAVVTTYYYQEEAILTEVEASLESIETYALP